jgi:hypothetical protein
MFINSLGLGALGTFALGLGLVGGSRLLSSPRVTGSMFRAGLGTLGVAAGGVGLGVKALWQSKLLGTSAKLANAGAQFAVRHPYMTLGGAGTAAWLASDTSPYDSPSLGGVRMQSRFRDEAEAMESLDYGVSPMGGATASGAGIRNQRMMESTLGLTQGLHRSRH